MDKPVVPRLKDVAREANVSLTSASRILRGVGDRYAEETQQRVFAASRKLGWRRNLLVNGMQTGKTRTIGVMLPPYDSFWVNVTDGIHAALSEVDYLPITVWPTSWRQLGVFEAQKEEGHLLISRLLDRRVDALILWPAYAVAYCEHYRELSDRTVPVGVIDHLFADDQFGDMVEADEAASVEQIAEYLYARGHRRLACFSAREIAAHTWAVQRRTSFSAAVERLAGAECQSWSLNTAGDNGPEVAREILTSDFRPTAIFCVTDHEACYVYQQASRLGLKIPRDISVVGFGGLDFAELLTPALTTMQLDGVMMGKTLCGQILNRLDNEAAKPVLTKVPARLTERESVTDCRPSTTSRL